VDERIDVAVVESTRAGRREIGLSNSLDQKRFDIAGFTDGGWTQSALCPVEISSNQLLPGKTILARICRSDPHVSVGSGGFLLDLSGRFLGIITGVEKTGVSQTLRSYSVVPTDILNDSLRKLVETRENLRAGYLGIYLDSDGKRIVVSGVGRDTPAADAGLLPGDTVVSVDSQPVQDLNEFGKILRWKGPGGELELGVEREGDTRRIKTVLSCHPEQKLVYGWKLELPRIWGGETEVEQELKLSPMPLPSNMRFGLVVDTLSPQLASYFKVPGGKGLLVTSVLEESLASKSGFQAGDVLIEINGTILSSPGIMREVLYTGREGVLAVRFVRNGNLQSRDIVFP